jgi:predicted AAA+ superfamily ATPase
MSGDLATLLSGRDIPIEIFPLSFREFLEFRGIEANSEKDVPSESLK